MNANDLDEKSISILKLLKRQGALWVREIGRQVPIRRADVIKRLRSLLKGGYILRLEERREHGRDYYAFTSKAEGYLQVLREKEKLKEEAVEALKREHHISEEESTEVYDDLKSDLDSYFNRVAMWYPDTASFSIDLTVHSKDYDGSIVMEWNLTSQGKRKLRPEKKLRPKTIVFRKKPGPKK